MKNILLLFCSLLALHTNAQTAINPSLSFGGISTGSTVSILQVKDYPVLQNADKSKKIKSYDFTVLIEGIDGPYTFSIKSPKLNQTVMNYLANVQNKKGKIYIENIVYEGNEVATSSDKLVLYFNQ